MSEKSDTSPKDGQTLSEDGMEIVPRAPSTSLSDDTSSMVLETFEGDHTVETSSARKSRKRKMSPEEKNARKMSRNESEKIRRDRLNMYIYELARIVPLITNAHKKMDKSSILRLTVNYLRIHYELNKSSVYNTRWRPSFLEDSSIGEHFLSALNGFLCVVLQKGLIIYVSDSISEILGHNPVDVIGHQMETFLSGDDMAVFQRQFEEEKRSEPERPQSTFSCQWANACSKTQERRYTPIQMVGHIRLVKHMEQAAAAASQELPEDLCLVAVGMPMARNPLLPELSVPKNQADLLSWVSLHDMTGHLFFSEHMSSLVMGFTPEESYGRSAYDYVHPEDIEVVERSHDLLIKGQIPYTVVRIFSHSNEMYFLQTKTNVVFDKWTKKPKHIVSVNLILKPEEGRRLMKLQPGRLRGVASLQDVTHTESRSSSDSSAQPSPVLHHSSSVESQGMVGGYVSPPEIKHLQASLAAHCQVTGSRDPLASSSDPEEMSSYSSPSCSMEAMTDSEVFQMESPGSSSNVHLSQDRYSSYMAAAGSVDMSPPGGGCVLQEVDTQDNRTWPGMERFCRNQSPGVYASRGTNGHDVMDSSIRFREPLYPPSGGGGGRGGMGSDILIEDIIGSSGYQLEKHSRGDGNGIHSAVAQEPPKMRLHSNMPADTLISPSSGLPAPPGVRNQQHAAMDLLIASGSSRNFPRLAAVSSSTSSSSYPLSGDHTLPPPGGFSSSATSLPTLNLDMLNMLSSNQAISSSTQQLETN